MSAANCLVSHSPPLPYRSHCNTNGRLLILDITPELFELMNDPDANEDDEHDEYSSIGGGNRSPPTRRREESDDEEEPMSKKKKTNNGTSTLMRVKCTEGPGE